MSGRLCGAPLSTSLTLWDKHTNINYSVQTEECVVFVLITCIMPFLQLLIRVSGLTCHDAGTSYQHKQWRGLVQKCPSDTDRKLYKIK